MIEQIENVQIQNNHIVSLSFSSEKAKSLKRTEEWNHIPVFSVISGPNGSSKTHLLDYANFCLEQRNQDPEFHSRHIYLPANNNETSIASKYVSTSVLGSANKTWNRHCDKVILKESMNFLPAEAKSKEFILKLQMETDEQFLKVAKSAPFEKKGEIKPKSLEELLKKYFSYYIARGRSIRLLEIIFLDYQMRKENYLSQNPPISELKLYASQNYQIIFPQKYADEDKMLEDFDNIKEEVKTRYIASKIPELGESPVDEINAIFKNYQFNFKVVEGKKIPFPRLDIERTDIPCAPTIGFDDLSTGEKKILEMLTWLYYYLPNKNFDDLRPSIILLDEPDRHLDPKLLAVFLQIIQDFVENKNVQVIMTTHRPDTIKEVPEESIFMLDRDKKNGVPKVVPVYRSHAQYRIMPNLREMMSIRIKVYAESTSDAEFYSGVYRSFFEYSNKQRLKGQDDLVFQLKTYNETNKKRILSRRYKLFFVAASQSEGNNGGWSKIAECLSRDKDILDKFEKEKGAKLHRSLGSLEGSEFYSLGIIDNDGKMGKYDGAFKKTPSSFVQIDGRYTIENFLFDPFVLCSSLESNEAAKLVKFRLKEGDQAMKGAILQEKQKEFQEICEQIKKDLRILKNMESDGVEDIQKIGIQAHLDAYFIFFQNVLDNNNVSEKKQDQKSDKKNQKAQINADESKVKASEQIAEHRGEPSQLKKQNQNPKQKENHKKHDNTDQVSQKSQENPPEEEKSEQLERKNSNLSCSQQTQTNTDDSKIECSEKSSRIKEEQIQLDKDNNSKKGADQQEHQTSGNGEKLDIIVLASVNKVFSIRYPNAFFHKNAKEIEDKVFKEGMKKRIVDSIYGNGLKFIPADLSKAIFRLNELAVKRFRGDKVREISSSKDVNSEKV